MKKILRIFIILYSLTCCLTIVSKYLNLNLFIFIKPFTITLIIALFVIIFIYYKKVYKTSVLILSGLIFGYIADMIFIKESDNVLQFLSGLFFFLLGHICYIIGFFKNKIKLNLLVIILMVFVLISWLVFILSNSWNKYNFNVFLPVIIYSTILSFMFLSAYNYELNLYNKFDLISLGALIFVASDMTFSYIIFIYQFKNGAIAVLTTYFIAQGFIGFKTISNYINYYLKK